MQTDSLNIPDSDGQTYRLAVNEALQAVATSSAGSSAPPDTYPYMEWLDTSVSPPVLKRRNAADSGWERVDSDPDSLSDATLAGAERVAVKQSGSWLRTTTSSIAAFVTGIYTVTLRSGVGAVARTLLAILRDKPVSAKDFGAVGDGVAVDTAAISAVKTHVDALPSAVVDFSGGRYKTTGTFWPNNVSPTTMYFDKPSVLGVFDGSESNPNTTDNDPAVFVQKYTAYDNGSDRFAHNVGGVFGSVFVKGTGQTGSSDTDGTWIGVLGNAVLDGQNRGTSAAPDFDAYGNSIGMAGFARLNGYPGSGNIACGVWGYAEGPSLDATTHANLPETNWSIVGAEVNIQINHPDIGDKSLLVGKGSSVGWLAKNYRTAGTGVMDWTFGAVFDGTPDDNDYGGTDVSQWSGFYTGICLDKIKKRGILFGKYFATGSYGIEFPASYAGFAQRPKAAAYFGDNVVNMGQYTGSTFNDYDLWQNGGYLYFRSNAVNERIVTTRAGVLNLPSTTKITVAGVDAGAFSSVGDAAIGGNFGSEALRGVRVTNAVNRVEAFGAIDGNAVVVASAGTSTNVPMEYRSKGAARQFWTINGVEVGSWSETGHFLISVVGKGIRVKEGANAKQGVATLVGGTVTVSNTAVTANSRIFLTSQSDGGTPGFLRVSSRVAGTSFTITSSSGTDTSVVAYEIFEPA